MLLAAPDGNLRIPSRGNPYSSLIASPKRRAGEDMIGGEDTDAKGPKGGFAQKKVLKKKQDLSGRSTIIPSGFHKYEPTDGLDIDEVGLPEEMAWTIYEPFVRNRLSKKVGPARAKKEYENRSKRARQELEKEMGERPVLMNRAPSWWPYNIMAHKPVLIEEKTGDDSEKAIRIPNMVINPYYGGDFDGCRSRACPEDPCILLYSLVLPLPLTTTFSAGPRIAAGGIRNRRGSSPAGETTTLAMGQSAPPRRRSAFTRERPCLRPYLPQGEHTRSLASEDLKLYVYYQ